MQLALVVAALAAVCSAGLVVHSLVRPFVRDFVRRTALRIGLPLDEGTEQVMIARVAARERWAAAGGATGALLPVVLLLPAERSLVLDYAGGSLGGTAVLLGFVAGTGLGVGVLASRDAARPVRVGGPRVARTSVPRVRDYVAPHERWGAWLVVAACVAVTVGTALRDGPGLPGMLVAAACSIPLLAAAGTEILLRRLVGARQPASSPLGLAWDDVLRARTARDLVTVPFVAGAYLLLAVLTHAGETGALPDGLAIPLVLAFSLVVTGAGALLDPRGHVRRRLWPQPPARTAVPAVGAR